MKRYKLRNLLQIKNGKDHKNLGKGKIPVFGSGGIMRYVDRAIYNEESILLPRKGTLSNIQYVSQPFWTVDTIYYSVINRELVNTFFLYNYLKILDLTRLNSGTGVPSMTFESYYDLTINLPDLDSQQKIASVLSALDAKIELNNRINTELEAMAKTLYDYWFVQFDFPDEQGKPYKSSGGKMVWSNELKRDIPNGWEVQSLYKNDLANIISPGISQFDGYKTYLSTSCINYNNIINLNQKITYNNRESRANMQPLNNSIWFAKMKDTKKTLYFGEYSQFFLNEIIISTGMCGLSCKSKECLEYLWHIINSNQFEIQKNSLSHGSTQKAINISDLFFLKIIIPNKTLIQEYHKKTNLLYKIKYLNENQNFYLTTLRDWLLPMLMNGQVKVK